MVTFYEILKEKVYGDLYHGSKYPPERDSGLKNPDKKRYSYNGSDTVGVYFTDNEPIASTYGPYITKADIELKDPKIVDFENNVWCNSPLKDENDFNIKVDQLTLDAKEDGNDGLVALNIKNDFGDLEKIEKWYNDNDHNLEDDIVSDLIIPFHKKSIKNEKHYLLEKYYKIVNSEFDHLTEAKKKELLKALLLAGALSTSLLGIHSIKTSFNREPPPIERECTNYHHHHENFIDDNYSYLNNRIGEVIEKYRGELSPFFIEVVLWTESKYGKHMKYDDKGAGLAQVSKICVEDYNKINKTNYKHEDVFYNDYLNLKIGLWYLNRCRDRFIANLGYEPDELDIYLMYNNGISGYLNNMSKLRNHNFKPTERFLQSWDYINSLL